MRMLLNFKCLITLSDKQEGKNVWNWCIWVRWEVCVMFSLKIQKNNSFGQVKLKHAINFEIILDAHAKRNCLKSKSNLCYKCDFH